MQCKTITRGDDLPFEAKLLKHGLAFTIDTRARVRAVLKRGDEALVPVVECSPNAPGADWTKSIVTVIFQACDTAKMEGHDAWLEIEVDDQLRQTWHSNRMQILDQTITC